MFALSGFYEIGTSTRRLISIQNYFVNTVAVALEISECVPCVVQMFVEDIWCNSFFTDCRTDVENPSIGGGAGEAFTSQDFWNIGMLPSKEAMRLKGFCEMECNSCTADHFVTSSRRLFKN